MGKMLTQLRKDNIQAMKEHDTLKKGVLSLMISAIALAEKENGKELSPEEELVYIQKELKQTKETLETIPADRVDLRKETDAKIALIESYLPKQMSEEEIRDAILQMMKEQGLEPVKKAQGLIMKAMLAQYKGQTDGKTVNRILADILK